jgi:hypothetical protein
MYIPTMSVKREMFTHINALNIYLSVKLFFIVVKGRTPGFPDWGLDLDYLPIIAYSQYCRKFQALSEWRTYCVS